MGEGLFVSRPEYCLLQMASTLSLVGLIELGYELCGNYSLAPLSSVNGDRETSAHFNRRPLTNTKKIAAFLGNANGLHGRKKAIRALRYVLDGSASPMETILVLLLTLPFKMGGYHLPMPELNARMLPSRRGGQSASKAHYSCDLYWPDQDVTIEYDSDAFHTGGTSAARDAQKRNYLTATGLAPFSVTPVLLYNADALDGVAVQVAASLGKRLQYEKVKFVKARASLRKELLRL